MQTGLEQVGQEDWARMRRGSSREEAGEKQFKVEFKVESAEWRKKKGVAN